MSKKMNAVKKSLSALLLAGAQVSVLVAVVASQFGERVVRGARGFAVYRAELSEQS